jgi:two-component system cell cycle response regulator DivK
VTLLLYIEDDPGHADLVSSMLTSRGFAVEIAKDGLIGVQMARHLKPDIILLDLMLPHLDGFGVMRALAEDAATQHIPVIVISAWPTADNRKRVRQAGARSFIAKPFQSDEVVVSIQEALSKSSEASQGGV